MCANVGVVVTLTDAHPRVRCVFDNEFVAAGAAADDALVLVTKTIAGTAAGKQGAVTLRLSCDDGTVGAFQVPAGATGTLGTEAPFVVPDGTSCTLTETRTGEKLGRPARTATTMKAGRAAVVAARTVAFTTTRGAPITVAVTDVYGGLAPSGAGAGTGATALAGLLLLTVGAALTLATRRGHG